MRKIILLILPLLLLLSCENVDSFPKTENITRGTKWTLQIGSTHTEVYSQLQELGVDKNFDDVSITYRQPFSNPNEIKSDLSLYRAITLEAPSERIERVLIQFDQDKVKSIEKGGALLDDIAKWPLDTSDEIAIHINDPLNKIREKLLAIYQIPAYENYQIILSNKWLEKPYDPDMANYDEWAFAFSEDISSQRVGLSSVSLFFKSGKLSKIRHMYNEVDMVN